MCLSANFSNFLNLSFSSASEEEIGKQIHTVMLWLWPHTHLCLYSYCLFVSTYLHPFSLDCRESNWLHMMLCLPCVLWCSWGLRSRAMRWGPFATVSMCAMFSHFTVQNSPRIFSMTALKEPVAQKTYENILHPKIKLKKYHSYLNVSYCRILRFITVCLYKYVLPSPVHNRNYTFMQNNYWVAHFLLLF